MPETYEITVKCPICDAVQQAATDLSKAHRRPAANDFAVCFRCGAASIFTDETTLRHLTADELVDREVKQPGTFLQVLHSRLYIKSTMS